MRFVADESCDFAIVKALRWAGHDVTAIAELKPAAEDDLVLRLALSEARVLLTEDKDFGTLVYARGQQTAGVVEDLIGAFVVVEPGRARISKIPQGPKF